MCYTIIGGIMKTISFFGHRQIFNNNIIKSRLIEKLKEYIPQGYSKTLIGCHGDFDNLSLSACLDIKNNFFPFLDVSVVLTSLSFLNKNKNGYSKADYYKNKGCNILFYNIEEVYFKNTISFSNKKMVDESNLIICYVDMRSSFSGAKNAVLYAIKKKKLIINLFNEEDRKIIHL